MTIIVTGRETCFEIILINIVHINYEHFKSSIKFVCQAECFQAGLDHRGTTRLAEKTSSDVVLSLLLSCIVCILSCIMFCFVNCLLYVCFVLCLICTNVVCAYTVYFWFLVCKFMLFILKCLWVKIVLLK